MSTRLLRHAAATLMGVALCAAGSASANQLITNGGFENGFIGWSLVDQIASEGTFNLQTGITSPINGETVPPPPGGNFAAMTDQQGPGAHALIQSIDLPDSITSATLSFDLFIGNRAEDFYVPDLTLLTFDTPELNQQARVDLVEVNEDTYFLPSAIATLFQTQSGDPLVSGYTHFEFDLTAVLAARAGATVVLRFAEIDNVGMFQFGVDNVSLVVNETPVSEPGTAALLLASGLLVGSLGRKRSGLQ